MKKPLVPIIIGVLLIVLIDLAVKYWADTSLRQPVFILSDFFRLELHKNSGIAFSLPLRGLVQILLSVVLLAFLVYFWISTKRSATEHAALAMVMGGALGNLVERIAFGQVTDYIAVWNFPVFNIADSTIFLGVCTLLWFELFLKKGREIGDRR